jgi:hypothetical protein
LWFMKFYLNRKKIVFFICGLGGNLNMSEPKIRPWLTSARQNQRHPGATAPAIVVAPERKVVRQPKVPNFQPTQRQLLAKAVQARQVAKGARARKQQVTRTIAKKRGPAGPGRARVMGSGGGDPAGRRLYDVGGPRMIAKANGQRKKNT